MLEWLKKIFMAPKKEEVGAQAPEAPVETPAVEEEAENENLSGSESPAEEASSEDLK